MRPIATDGVAWFACRSVCHAREFCKKKTWTDRDVIYGSKEPCVRWGRDPLTGRGNFRGCRGVVVRSKRNNLFLDNGTICDEAFCQNSLTTGPIFCLDISKNKISVCVCMAVIGLPVNPKGDWYEQIRHEVETKCPKYYFYQPRYDRNISCSEVCPYKRTQDNKIKFCYDNCRGWYHFNELLSCPYLSNNVSLHNHTCLSLFCLSVCAKNTQAKNQVDEGPSMYERTTDQRLCYTDINLTFSCLVPLQAIFLIFPGVILLHSAVPCL